MSLPTNYTAEWADAHASHDPHGDEECPFCQDETVFQARCEACFGRGITVLRRPDTNLVLCAVCVDSLDKAMQSQKKRKNPATGHTEPQDESYNTSDCCDAAIDWAGRCKDCREVVAEGGYGDIDREYDAWKESKMF